MDHLRKKDKRSVPEGLDLHLGLRLRQVDSQMVWGYEQGTRPGKHATEYAKRKGTMTGTGSSHAEAELHAVYLSVTVFIGKK